VFPGCTLKGKVPSDISHVNRIVHYRPYYHSRLVGLFITKCLLVVLIFSTMKCNDGFRHHNLSMRYSCSLADYTRPSRRITVKTHIVRCFQQQNKLMKLRAEIPILLISSSAPTAWDFSPGSWEFGVNLGFEDSAVQSWDFLLS